MQRQAWIYLLRISTIPFSNLEMRLFFRIFRLIFFSLFKLQKCITNRLHIYIHKYIYACYIQLLSFQTLQTRKILEKETYFHYFLERVQQLLHSCAALNFLTFPKIFKLSELFRSLFSPNKQIYPGLKRCKGCQKMGKSVRNKKYTFQ